MSDLIMFKNNLRNFQQGRAEDFIELSAPY